MAATLAAGLAACSDGDSSDGATATSTSSTTPATTTTSSGASTSSTATSGTTTAAPVRSQSTVVRNLDVPWSVAFLPDGSALVTLRDEAKVLRVRDGASPVTVATIAEVEPQGEGGLLGAAISPRFASDHRVFLYYTAARDNRVVRYRLDGDELRDAQPVLTGIPKAGNHNGGRLAFGPDGYLYVTTGDAGNGNASQDRNALGGKILRITQDGAPAPGNPFGTRVWSWGHRNVQGIAWAPDGRMFASEFGQNTWDELNLIEPGGNYGWPVVEGRARRSGYTDPLAQWPTSDASPSGIAIADGAVYMAALRGQSLWRIPLSSNGIGEPKRLLRGTYGRLRDAVAGPDGRLWVLTSNTFRGSPAEDDDRVLALPLDSLR